MELEALRVLTRGLATLSQLEDKHPVLGEKLAEFVQTVRDCCQEAYFRYSLCLDSVIKLPKVATEEQLKEVRKVLVDATSSAWFRDVSRICDRLRVLANDNDSSIRAQIDYAQDNKLQGAYSLGFLLRILHQHERELKGDIASVNRVIEDLLNSPDLTEARDVAANTKAEIDRNLTDIMVISARILGTRKNGAEEFFGDAGPAARERVVQAQKPTVVVLMHGIRTDAEWHQRLRVLLTERSGYKVLSIKYGYFNLFRFWCPFGICRNGSIDYVADLLQQIREDYRDHRMVVFAHSFGTYAIAKILAKGRLKLDRLVLLGSIVPKRFNWDPIRRNQITHPGDADEGIVNEVGILDVWPVLAQSTTWGYGDSGTFGFGHPSVRDRYHPCDHSAFFKDKFLSDFCLPAAAGLSLDFTETERRGVSSPWWFKILRLPILKLAVASTLVAAIWFGGSYLV